jgi:hypothetical protein
VIRDGGLRISNPNPESLPRYSACTPATAGVTRKLDLHLTLFAVALFLSAFLLFLVEPMVAKMVLPILGGAPMVWNTCVVFFQIMMLLGYGYAYGSSKGMHPRHHTIVHAVLLFLPLAVLPVVIQAGSASVDSRSPVLSLMLMLGSTVGLPFAVLSTSASVLQHWFSRIDHPAARDPYFLYVASNLGSLLALACYPIVVEPTLTLRAQSQLWALGYLVFVAITCACGVVVWRGVKVGRREHLPPTEAHNVSVAESPSVRQRAEWVMLAFVPSSLMLGVTNYVTTDVAAVPLLWIMPLGLYLLTFVIAFSSKSEAARTAAHRALPLLIVPLTLFMVAKAHGPFSIILPLHIITFAVAALVCHSELAHKRPSTAHLTAFYFWISFGGMVGGLFNTLVAPRVFSGIDEYPLALVLTCLFSVRTMTVPARSLTRAAGVPIAVGLLTAGLIQLSLNWHVSLATLVCALTVPAMMSFAQKRQPARFASSVGAMLLAGVVFANSGQTLHAERTFFGVYRVSLDPTGQYHKLAHGTTLHGMQALDLKRHGEPLTYYHRTGPFGQAFTELSSIMTGTKVAVIGLGVGTLASYARPGQHWTFYEIDPAVERIARTSDYFTYLDTCGTRCDVVLGDARLSLARAARPYDVIVLDAFSSDAIPVHLITNEAIALYLTRLAPDGVLLFHVSNRHLNLGPVLAKLAASHGLVALEQSDRVKQGVEVSDGKLPSDWVVMARRRQQLSELERSGRWRAPIIVSSTPLWTDDFSNILSVLNLR